MYNRFAEKRRRYLREHWDGIYTGMLLTGKLDEYLKEIGDTAQEMFDQLVEQMKKVEGVTERLLLKRGRRLFLAPSGVEINPRFYRRKKNSFSMSKTSYCGIPVKVWRPHYQSNRRFYAD